jgi:choline dehydrogenase-like flavoprotein
MTSADPFDAVVVGSGASGGWVAKDLSEAGLRVALIEAGRKLDPAVDFSEHKRAYDAPLRLQKPNRQQREEQPLQSRAGDELSAHLFVKDTENPYTTAPDKPFSWIRSRQVGGKSITWGRQTYRLSDFDLKAASHDGYGVDWPLSYSELAPYYDKVERFIGISGRAESLPQLPDSVFLPPMPFTCGEEVLRKGVAAKLGKSGRLVTIGRCAVLTAPLNGRPACHYCGPCHRGCSAGPYYSSPASTIPAAERTGRLTLIPDAVVSHVETGPDGRARSVACVDRVTRAHREVFGKAIVLCASTLESTRILLNSRGPKHPAGLGNSSGVLGHYLMDHFMGAGAYATLPVLGNSGAPSGHRPNGIYVPRFRNLKERHPDFIRGYGFQGGSSFEKWKHGYRLPGFGAGLKDAIRQGRYWHISLVSFGECLARHENFCELDPEKVDAWGIPVLRISMDWGDNEKKMLKDAQETAREMVEAAGGENVSAWANISRPGSGIHEVGTARMGDDPKTSVTDRWQQAHDVANLFLMDGSVYPSSACQNPTLTIMALAARACDHLIERFRRGEFA